MKPVFYSLLFPLVFCLLYPGRTASQVFACIGDFGDASQAEKDVSDLVKSWKSEFIITTGDNNYFYGDSLTIDTNIGYFYHPYIFPYYGKFSDSTDTTTINRFFPSLGNHDLYTANGQPYFDYFTLPGNERYYDFVWGNVHFFVLNSDSTTGYEPDGVSSTSVQGAWLMGKLAASVSKWKLVYFHHPPFSSSVVHGSSSWMQWPFEQWGATAVFSGHDHVYERLRVGNIPYFVNGLGGRSAIYNFGTLLPGSEKQYNGNYGAMRISAFPDSIVFEFVNIADSVADKLVIGGNSPVEEFGNYKITCRNTPNPFSGSTCIILPRELNNASLEIFDSMGNVTQRREKIVGKRIVVNVKNPGLYFYRLGEKGKTLAEGKMICTD